MTSITNILWVDDDHNGLKNWIPILEPYGCKIETAENGRVGIAKLQQKKYDKVLVDLEMPVMNGVEFLAHVFRNYPTLPATIISAHIDEPSWKLKINKLKRQVRRIDSPLPIEGSVAFEETIKSIFEEISFEHNNCPPLIVYVGLDNDTIGRMKRDVFNANKSWIERQLETLDAEWILVRGGQVIDHSTDRDTFPDSEELLKIGSVTNQVPFLFFKTPTIEEINWSYCPSKNDYFPTIEVTLENNGFKVQRLGDFDTGAEISFLDYDDLSASNIVKESIFDMVQDGIHLGEKYEFFKKKMSIELLSVSRDIEKMLLPVIFVKNWKKGPFVKVNKSRQALLGRDLLSRTKFRIELIPSEKITRLVN